MKVIKNPAEVEDRDLAKAYETTLKFLEEKGFGVKKVKMAISPFAPTYKKAMIVKIFPCPEDVVELVNLEQALQKKIGKSVGISLV